MQPFLRRTMFPFYDDPLPDDTQGILEQGHEELCKDFAERTLPCYKEDPLTWPPDSFDKVLSFIVPYIAHLRLLGNAAAKYPNLDQLVYECQTLGPNANARASYAKGAFENNERLHAELVAVVDEAAKSEANDAVGK